MHLGQVLHAEVIEALRDRELNLVVCGVPAAVEPQRHEHESNFVTHAVSRPVSPVLAVQL